MYSSIYIINRTIHECLEICNLFLVFTRISLVNTRNKFHICAHPCTLLLLNFLNNEFHKCSDLRSNTNRKHFLALFTFETAPWPLET